MHASFQTTLHKRTSQLSFLRSTISCPDSERRKKLSRFAGAPANDRLSDAEAYFTSLLFAGPPRLSFHGLLLSSQTISFVPLLQQPFPARPLSLRTTKGKTFAKETQLNPFSTRCDINTPFLRLELEHARFHTRVTSVWRYFFSFFFLSSLELSTLRVITSRLFLFSNLFNFFNLFLFLSKFYTIVSIWQFLLILKFFTLSRLSNDIFNFSSFLCKFVFVQWTKFCTVISIWQSSLTFKFFFFLLFLIIYGFNNNILLCWQLIYFSSAQHFCTVISTSKHFLPRFQIIACLSNNISGNL